MNKSQNFIRIFLLKCCICHTSRYPREYCSDQVDVKLHYTCKKCFEAGQIWTKVCPYCRGSFPQSILMGRKRKRTTEERIFEMVRGMNLEIERRFNARYNGVINEDNDQAGPTI